MRLAEFKIKGGEFDFYKVLFPPDKIMVTVSKDGQVRVCEIGTDGAGYEVEGSVDKVRNEVNTALNHGDSKLLKELKKAVGK